MHKQYEATHIVVGPGDDMQEEVTVLNRSTRWGKSNISLEADAKHAMQILKDLHMEDCTAAPTPGVRDAFEHQRQERTTKVKLSELKLSM